MEDARGLRRLQAGDELQRRVDGGRRAASVPAAAMRSASVPCISSIAIDGVPSTSEAPKTNTQCS